MSVILKEIELKAVVNGKEVAMEVGDDFKVIVTGTLTVDFSNDKGAE